MKLVVCIVLATCVALLFAVTPGCSSIKWKSVSQRGSGHTIAIRDDGTLWAWGDNRDFQLGDGNSSIFRASQYQIGTENNWETVSVGYYHSLAIKKDGTLWGWGNNDFGQLGNKDIKKVISPIQIGKDSSWVAVEGGDWHTIALKNDSTLWGCGKNADGQLGNDNKTNQVELTQIGKDADWKSISLGFSFTLAIKNNGSLYGWGKNEHLQLANMNAPRDIAVPTQIGTAEWKSVSAGLHGSAGIQKDGTLFIWGCAYFGKCDEIVPQPKKLDDATTNWKSVTMTDYAGIALKEDGTLHAWGTNYYGQLGEGEIGVYRKELKQIGKENDWESVRAGQSFTLGFKKNGQYLAWGGNSWGQLAFGYKKEYEKVAVPAVCGTFQGCHNQECSVCPASYLLQGYNCNKCDAECAECAGLNNTCTKCPTGKLLKDAECKIDCDAKCKNCDRNAKFCTECKLTNEFINFKNNRTCDTCNEICATCSGNSTTCTSCAAGLFLTGKTCEKCNTTEAGCKTCANSATNCTSCLDANLTLTADGRCVRIANGTNTGETKTEEKIVEKLVEKTVVPTWLIIVVAVNVILIGLIGYYVGFKRAKNEHYLNDRLTDKELEM